MKVIVRDINGKIVKPEEKTITNPAFYVAIDKIDKKYGFGKYRQGTYTS